MAKKGKKIDERRLERYYGRLEYHVARMNKAKLEAYEAADDFDVWLNHNKATQIERINVNYLERCCEAITQEQTGRRG